MEITLQKVLAFALVVAIVSALITEIVENCHQNKQRCVSENHLVIVLILWAIALLVEIFHGEGLIITRSFRH